MQQHMMKLYKDMWITCLSRHGDQHCPTACIVIVVIVPIPQIYSIRCQYDTLKVLFKKNGQNLPIGCAKHRNGTHSQNALFYMQFQEIL